MKNEQHSLLNYTNLKREGLSLHLLLLPIIMDKNVIQVLRVFFFSQLTICGGIKFANEKKNSGIIEKICRIKPYAFIYENDQENWPYIGLERKTPKKNHSTLFFLEFSFALTICNKPRERTRG